MKIFNFTLYISEKSHDIIINWYSNIHFDYIDNL